MNGSKFDVRRSMFDVRPAAGAYLQRERQLRGITQRNVCFLSFRFAYLSHPPLMIASSHRCIAFTRSAPGSVELLEDRIAPATLVGLNTSDQLVIFDSTGTGGGSPISVTGLQLGEHLLGIDFRPATGELFALGDSRRLYTIDLENGAATAINSAPFDLPL